MPTHPSTGVAHRWISLGVWGWVSPSHRRNQQILQKLQKPEAEEISDDEVVCVADGDIQIVEPPAGAKKGEPLTLVLRTRKNKSFEVETTTVRA